MALGREMHPVEAQGDIPASRVGKGRAAFASQYPVLPCKVRGGGEQRLLPHPVAGMEAGRGDQQEGNA